MKICLLGGTGLLGTRLKNTGKSFGHTIFTCARKNADLCFDITDDNALTSVFSQNDFDLVVNACAIVDHAYCEQNQGVAYRVNSRPSAIISTLSKTLRFKYVYISTDGYFCGDNRSRHSEESPISLLNEYVRTKYAGEQFALTAPRALVVRTNIIGFSLNGTGKGFLDWVLTRLKSSGPIPLFSDYITSSFTAAQFSKFFYSLVATDPSGIVNLASRDVFSKEEMIRAIADRLGFSERIKEATVKSIKTLSSHRAESLGLDVRRAETILQTNLPTFVEVIDDIEREYANICK